MVYIGLMGAGLVPAPASPAATAKELAAIVDLVKPYAVVVHPTCRQTLSQAIKQVSERSRPVVTIGMTKDFDEHNGNIFALVNSVKSEAVLPFAGLEGQKGSETLALVPFSRYATLLKAQTYDKKSLTSSCDSGTTGAFKGVMLSHTNIISNVLQLMQGWADYWEPKPRSISFLVCLLFIVFPSP